MRLLAASLVDNPFGHELFLPTVARVGALLGVAAVVVLIVERKRLAHIRDSSLFKKVLSWSVMAPAYLAAVFIGGPVGFLIVGFMIVQGLAEYSRLIGLRRRYSWLLLGSGVATFAFTGTLTQFFLLAPLAFFVVVTAFPIVTGDITDAHHQVTGSLFGYIYIPFMLSYLAFIKVLELDGVEILVLTGIAVALSDIVAFTVGSLIGGPKLAPMISPNKTWAGAAGNVVGAYAGWLLMWFAIPGDWSLTTRLAVPAITAVAALYGDLTQSFVKRDFGVKDAGDLLPGFGGLLDRIDSFLVGLPLSYYAIVISQHFTVGPR
jgi:phosphatidate cytidylyltransferase